MRCTVGETFAEKNGDSEHDWICELVAAGYVTAVIISEAGVKKTLITDFSDEGLDYIKECQDRKLNESEMIALFYSEQKKFH